MNIHTTSTRCQYAATNANHVSASSVEEHLSNPLVNRTSDNSKCDRCVVKQTSTRLNTSTPAKLIADPSSSIWFNRNAIPNKNAVKNPNHEDLKWPTVSANELAVRIPTLANMTSKLPAILSITIIRQYHVICTNPIVVNTTLIYSYVIYPV